MGFKSAIYIAIILLLESSVKGDLELTSVVETRSGPVVGSILNTVVKSIQYAAFRGIPYAEPPVGYLRFKPPVEKASWSNVYNATTNGNRCMQIDVITLEVVGSEDCLYLNVFTPHTNFPQSELKPVMVWIHGGAFKTGNSNSSYYGPDFLIEEDVIVVSFNYRLGPFGFLNLHHENATGNYGLKDQNLVLKWVQKNIAQFGGDPTQVTIFGQSAGSISVDLHILSDMSAGLFNRSISMSGSPLCLYWGFQTAVEAEAQAFKLGEKLGFKLPGTLLSRDTLLEKLQNAQAVDVIKVADEMSVIPFRPTLESVDVAPDQEKFLTECILKKYHSGNFTKGPHMMGYTSSETVSFARSISKLLEIVRTALKSVENKMSTNLFFLRNIIKTKEDAISKLSKAKINLIIQESSNLLFATGIDTKRKLIRAQNDHPVYYYRFSYNNYFCAHRSEGIDLEGVGHEDELPYVFYRPHIQLPLDSDEIQLTRRRFIRMWTNFAKYSNPTPFGKEDRLLGVIWPDSGKAGKYLEFGKDLSTRNTSPIGLVVKTLELSGIGTLNVAADCPVGFINNLKNITENVGHTLGSSVKTVSNTISVSVDKVKSAAHTVGDTIEDSARSVPIFFSDSLGRVKDTVLTAGNIAGNSANAVSNTVKNTGNKVANVLGNMKNHSKNVLSKIRLGK